MMDTHAVAIVKPMSWQAKLSSTTLKNASNSGPEGAADMMMDRLGI